MQELPIPIFLYCGYFEISPLIFSKLDIHISNIKMIHHVRVVGLIHAFDLECMIFLEDSK